jgi:hypothetical protein
MIGSSLRNDAGVSMEFGGFYSVARYWRLYIVRNHGAKETSFHGIEFYGYDYRINKLIDHLKLIEYEYVLVENVSLDCFDFFFQMNFPICKTIK